MHLFLCVAGVAVVDKLKIVWFSEIRLSEWRSNSYTWVGTLRVIKNFMFVRKTQNSSCANSLSSVFFFFFCKLQWIVLNLREMRFYITRWKWKSWVLKQASFSFPPLNSYFGTLLLEADYIPSKSFYFFVWESEAKYLEV